ncbi:MAG: family 10 glycosylhydrolase [Chloroflexota bacterium]
MRLRALLLAALICAVTLLPSTLHPATVSAQLFGGNVSAATVQGELRGLWVDAYHDGFKTRAQADRLLADARRANINALFVQIRRRGDAFYTRSLEPRADDSSLAADFDPLDYLIQQAHGGTPRMEIHAWIVALPIWGDRDRSPRSSVHAFTQHGPNAPGRENWISLRDDGQAWGDSYYLDPGHPDAARYTADIVRSIVREYDVDGIHLDRIRYFEGESDRRWGYNPTSIERFNARFGRSGRPEPNDAQWSQWRRDQVTALVRRIYLEAYAERSSVRVSAAVIPWGAGPRSRADWERTAAYANVFQDWRGWLEQGILDLAVPMNYFRESSGQGAWLDNWLEFQRENAYDRQVASGLGAYMNGAADSVAQIRRSLSAGTRGGRAAGVVLYSYAAPRRDAVGGEPDVWTSLSTPNSINGGKPPFGSWLPVPTMAWKVGANAGGFLLRTPGLDGARVEVAGPVLVSGETDGGGFFGVPSLPSGRYAISLQHAAGAGRLGEVEVVGGTVAQMELVP